MGKRDDDEYSVPGMMLVMDASSGSEESRQPEIQSLRLRENFGWTLLGNGVLYSCQALMLVVLAKLTTPESVGEFVLALAVAAPIVMFCKLQLRAVQVTDIANQYRFGHYLGLRLAMMLLAVLAAGAIGLIFFSQARAWLIVMVAASAIVTAVREVFHAAMQKRERMDYIAIAHMITGPANITVFGIAIFLTGNLLVAIGAIIVVKLCLLLFYDRVRLAHLGVGDESRIGMSEMSPIFDSRPLIAIAVIAIPLGIVMAMITLQANVPKYFLEGYVGTKMLGFFGVIAMFALAVELICNSLGQAAMPRLAVYYRDDVKAFGILVAKLAAIGLMLAIAGVLGARFLGQWALTVMFKSEYARYNDVLVLVMLVGGVNGIAAFMGFAMTAGRYFRVQVPISGLVLVVAIVACWLLVPAYGIHGAAMALLFAAVGRLVLQTSVVAYAIFIKRPADSL